MSFAIEKLVEEQPEVTPISLPPATETSPEAEVLRRAIRDPARVARVLRATQDWRDGVEKLARLATDGAPSNGFSTETIKLAPGEWQVLQKELITRISR